MTVTRSGPVRGYWLRIAMVTAAAAVGTTVMLVMVGRGALVETLTHGVVYSACIGVLAGAILPPVRHRLREVGRIFEWTATLLALFLVALAGTFLACVILGMLGLDYGRPLMKRFAISFEMNALIASLIGVAMTLYERLGFKVIGRRRGYYTDDGEDAVVMWSDSLLSPAFRERYEKLRQRVGQEVGFDDHPGD